MNNSNQSNWLFEQMVTYLQMDTLSNDIYDKLTALTENLGAGILTLKGNITQAGSNVTIPIGAFRFADASYVFLPYQTGIFGFADTQTLVVSGDGYIVARYSVTPTVANATNYSFPTAYYFVATPNATTDCVICTITAGVISSYGNFLINSAASQTEVNAGTINNKAVTPKTLSNATVPTRPIGEQSQYIANMKALWNQTLGIGVGNQSAELITFDTATSLWSQTYNAGGLYATGAALPAAGNWFITRIASDNSTNGVLLANNTVNTFIGYLTGSSITWTQITNYNDLISGLVNAIFNRVTVADYVKIGNQPTNSSSGLLINANLYYPAIVEPVMYAGKANTSFELGVAGSGVTQQAITFDPAGERPMINNLGGNYIAAKGIATIGDITANGGGIVASGGSDGAMWVLFANGLILQTAAVQVALVPNGTAGGSIALPKSITNRTTYNIQSSFGAGALVNGRISADIPGTTTITYSVYNNNANTGNQIIEFFVWSY